MMALALRVALSGRFAIRGLAFALAVACASCAPTPATPPPPARAPSTDRVGPSYRVEMLDVGTGLSILVKGHDFTMLYDAGSNDDRGTREANRTVAYLEHELGASGPARCQNGAAPSDAAERPIDHVFLSHPHRDHLSFLADVLGCFAAKNVWDSGNDAKSDGYQAFVDAVAREPGVTYHRARPSDDGTPSVGFREGDRLALGERASARVLSVRPGARDANDASIVLRVDLGRASMVLEGDAGGGDRKDPSSSPGRSSVEAELLARHRRELDVDILQVGHHGSKTSSRNAFLDAVSPRIALVSTGPMPYGDVVLPDAEVIAALGAHGARVLRSDEDDVACRTSMQKMGADDDGAPGGCTAYTLDIDGHGRIEVTRGPASD